MRSIRLEPFTTAHLSGAADLLSRRHRDHLAHQPLLAAVTNFRGIVERELEGASGIAALDGTEVVGYLFGRHATDEIGPHVWSTAASNAAREPDLVARLYEAAAERWVDAGLRRHFVYVPAMREHVEPWFWLSFGGSAIQAARPVEGPPALAGTAGLTVRLSTPADAPEIGRLERELYLHLQRSPSFSGMTVESEETFITEWDGAWEKPEYTHFVAEADGYVVGQLLLYRRPEGDLRVPACSIDLASVTTEPARRGTGVARAMTGHALAWARDHGIRTLITDWRATNRPAATVWPRMGFTRTYVRLYRSIP